MAAPATIYRIHTILLRHYSRGTNFYLHKNFESEHEKALTASFKLYPDFISQQEEENLFNEVEKTLKRLRYEVDHWDAAIVGYRETEKKDWNEENSRVLQRVRNEAFPTPSQTISLVHVLDLKAEGEIKPHVDSVKFCGSTIAGISLLSDAVMRLTHTQHYDYCADILLPRRSLYVMTGPARYDYNHAVLAPADSFFNGQLVPKTRRISIICRNEPNEGGC